MASRNENINCGNGPVGAGNLLAHFESIEKIMTVKREELIKLDRARLWMAKKIRKLAADHL